MYEKDTIKEILKDLNETIDNLSSFEVLNKIPNVMMGKFSPLEQQEIRKAMKEIESNNLKTK